MNETMFENVTQSTETPSRDLTKNNTGNTTIFWPNIIYISFLTLKAYASPFLVVVSHLTTYCQSLTHQKQRLVLRPTISFV